MRRHKSKGYGLIVESLPKTRAEALEIGAVYYFTGIPCRHGHKVARYTKGSSCTSCTRARNAGVKPQHFNRRLHGRAAAANLQRKTAAAQGAKTYTSSKPCPNGHNIRWVASTNCVQCDKDKRAERRESLRRARLQKLYGLTHQEHVDLFISQGKACAICGDVFARARDMHVDHCHSENTVRGLLCSRCNQGLGLFRDDTEIMQKAQEYLNAHSA